MMPFRGLRCVLAFLSPLLLVPPASAAWNDWLQQIEEKAAAVQDEEKPSNTATSLDRDTLARALRAALELGTERAVEQASRPGGYLDNPNIHIPLPPLLAQAAETLRRFGGATLVDNQERSINRAAEQAAPAAHTTDLLQRVRRLG